ncbi:GntR family transcriptional regulator [Roseibacillus ishigakijimensis]|uniref:GntR family transcriptional regulator n=1 Tax=Roseibacillus ishigakijimensis TaxID=454146 RepID=A0A934VI53_9BACT|nr:GntR family transcriptional regulator [Roseibacillus ishigakijimensis]MBK1834708.1 GntR family transcriptional regulator [Roseibacillus ishigakijimensis]
MLPFRLQIQDGLPASEQLFRAAVRAVLSEELPGGAIFPSVRVLAQELKVSPTTVHKAILQLKEGGFLVSRPGVGMVVVGKEKLGKDVLREQLREPCRELLREARLLGLKASDVNDLMQELENDE